MVEGASLGILLLVASDVGVPDGSVDGAELTLGAPEKEEGLDEVDGTKLGVPDGP